MGKQAIIIGAGPAGLTAAYELLKRTNIKPIILEKSGDTGGISKTINYKGNRMDIGGHRFFSKSDRVMNWWLNIIPLEKTSEETVTINYQNKSRTIDSSASQVTGEGTNPGLVMLLRKRLSRIYFLRKFFNYPIQLSIDTLRRLGTVRTARILLSYLFAQLVPRKTEKSLEDFLINRFGRELYLLFFKDYTEKVWGVPCKEISAEWGAQRIKGVSISKAIQHAAQMMMKRKKSAGNISQKGTETSLIERFLYPALGPGQLWEEVARKIEVLGGTILMHQNVKAIKVEGDKVKSIVAINSLTGEQIELEADYFFSTMPVQELIAGFKATGDESEHVIPADVKEIAAGLQYRDFITVGVLLEKLSTANNQTLDLKDTWIYIQERDVKVGRLQLFNNWSPYLVQKPGTVWIGMEYFCNEGDDFWSLTDEEIKRTAVFELEKMGLAQVQDVLDSTVHRIEKTYPAYFGTYNQFDKIRAFTDRFENLFLVGRNGMHKYNNADHSMLTAMTAVDNICAGIYTKDNIWSINTEQDYHEENIVKRDNDVKGKTNANDDGSTIGATVERSFKSFLFETKSSVWLLSIAFIAIPIIFITFKFLYPFAGFIFGDSYVYIESASQNHDINTYPIGYSKFLRLISVFTKSDTILVAVQYLLIEISTLGLIFTLFYFYKPSKAIQIILLLLVVLNPLNLYLANYISSDALFLALSIIWFTILIWLLNKPNTQLLVWHAITLLAAFTVRYNALYYPVISLIVLSLSRQRLFHKLLGYSATILLVLLFVVFTMNKYYELTKIRQFSPFTGWQIVNNAMSAYQYVDSLERKPVPDRFKKIDAMVSSHFDTSSIFRMKSREELEAKTYYMWSPWSPLQKYMHQESTSDSTASTHKKWAIVAPLYADYGSWLIEKYPILFIRHYILPNCINYYAPPLEFLSVYNMGVDSVRPVATKWFGYKSNRVKSAYKDFNVNILNFVPILAGISNVMFLCCSLCFVFLKKFREHRSFTYILIVTIILWIFNFFFSVFASPIALRFQAFPIIITISFAAMLIEVIYKAAYEHKTESAPYNQEYKSSLGT